MSLTTFSTRNSLSDDWEFSQEISQEISSLPRQHSLQCPGFTSSGNSFNEEISSLPRQHSLQWTGFTSSGNTFNEEISSLPRQHSLQCPGFTSSGNSFNEEISSLPRQHSLQCPGLEKIPSKCYCPGATCEQQYIRKSKHPRIIEPSSKLRKEGFNQTVQIRIPKKLQAFVGYGSCKHCYKALVTFVTYIQLQCGFRVRPDVIKKFSPPTDHAITQARHIIVGFGCATNFYIDTWAPFFQERFTTACGGTHRIQSAMSQFFATNTEAISSPFFKSTKNDKLEPYIQRIRTILEHESGTSMHKLSMCNNVLYECLDRL